MASLAILGEDPLEKDMATHSSILTWRIPWTEESGRLQSEGLQESHTTQRLNWCRQTKGAMRQHSSAKPKVITQIIWKTPGLLSSHC